MRPSCARCAASILTRSSRSAGVALGERPLEPDHLLLEPQRLRLLELARLLEVALLGLELGDLLLERADLVVPRLLVALRGGDVLLEALVRVAALASPRPRAGRRSR